MNTNQNNQGISTGRRLPNHNECLVIGQDKGIRYVKTNATGEPEGRGGGELNSGTHTPYEQNFIVLIYYIAS